MSSIDKDANSVEDRGPNELSGARRPLPPGAKGFLWLCVLIAIGIITSVVFLKDKVASTFNKVGNTMV